jgi:hypothetical protein
MTESAVTPTPPSERLKRLLLPVLSGSWTHLALGAGILLLDLFASDFLLFPILFVIPVALSAWFCNARLAYALAVLLPFGRLLTDEFVHHPSPFVYIVANCAIRMAVLVLLAFLVSRTARQTKALEQRVQSLVTVCAWSRTVEYEGEWISFEKYLLRRFNVNTSHGISPAEAEKAFGTKAPADSEAKPAAVMTPVAREAA